MYSTVEGIAVATEDMDPHQVGVNLADEAVRILKGLRDARALGLDVSQATQELSWIVPILRSWREHLEELRPQ